jgi:hypothetical protein
MHLNSTYWGKFYDKVVENQNKMLLVCPVKPVYNGHPRDSKVAVVQKWSLFRVWSFKITINIEKLWITLTVVDR